MERKSGRLHFDKVGDMVLRTGSRAGISHKLHGQSGKNQAIGQLFKGVFISFGQSGAAGTDCVHSIPGHTFDYRA